MLRNSFCAGQSLVDTVSARIRITLAMLSSLAVVLTSHSPATAHAFLHLTKAYTLLPDSTDMQVGEDIIFIQHTVPSLWFVRRSCDEPCGDR